MKLVWTLHLGDLLLKCCFEVLHAWDLVTGFDYALRILDSLLRNVVVLGEELVAGNDRSHVGPHGLITIRTND